ncbi:hypothetical protein, partial [Flavobacterium sp. WLB]|uniref:hypothetical protein n=1 Tax=Flavobacterium sp. WLB TaxID=2161662 RepID=UPI001A9C48DB
VLKKNNVERFSKLNNKIKVPFGAFFYAAKALRRKVFILLCKKLCPSASLSLCNSKTKGVSFTFLF